jgi:hypothetical protein
MNDTAFEIFTKLEQLFDELSASQKKRLMRIAGRVRPNMTEDDLFQPHDLPELRENVEYNYEDGYWAGVEAARIAIRARVMAEYRGEPEE